MTYLKTILKEMVMPKTISHSTILALWLSNKTYFDAKQYKLLNYI